MIMKRTLVPSVMITKFTAIVMAFGIVSNEGDIVLTHFYPRSSSAKPDVFQEVMETVV